MTSRSTPDAGHSFLNDLSLPSSVRTPAIFVVVGAIFVVVGKFNGPSGLASRRRQMPASASCPSSTVT